ncbi:MAG: chromate efflux transporter [Proteobacteria bacterium]|nr:chromate efflux transporter [Pseudomonadota bacterium]
MQDVTASSEPAGTGSHPSFGDALRTWTRIGLLSFGGPTAQIALMHKTIVDEKRWLSEQHFLSALSFCMLLPGPEAMQLATYVGWRLHGLAGGLAAGLLFVLPGATVVLTLAMIYASFGKVPFVEAVFYGIKAAVLVIVVEALLRVSKRALKMPVHWLIAAASFVGIFCLDLPFPVLIAIAAAIGFLSADVSPSNNAPHMTMPAVGFGSTVAVVGMWLTIWFGPLLLLSAVLGPNHIFAQVGWFFSKLAVVTFGGAYAVLAYMAQDVVQQHHWLEAGEMLDGLGLAETTPGPLILVTEFVGYLAAFKKYGVGGGILGAAVALWATFAPCFMWIFAGAPYIEWIISKPRLRGALAAITAAVVGIILNLTVWFALHVFFARVTPTTWGWLKLWVPSPSTLDWRVVVLAVVSGVLLLQRHWSLPLVLVVASALGLAVRLSGI